jgi:ketosteroid isomerase-like protein
VTPQAQEAHIHEFMRALARGDMDAAVAFLHPEFCLVEQPGLPYSGEWLGRDGFRRLWEVVGTTWSRWKDSPYPWELASVGDKVFKEVRFVATLAANGAQIEMDFVEVFEFRDDLISIVRPYYWDPPSIAAALDS